MQGLVTKGNLIPWARIWALQLLLTAAQSLGRLTAWRCMYSRHTLGTSVSLDADVCQDGLSGTAATHPTQPLQP